MTLLGQGCCQSEVARQVGVTPGAVSQWVKVFRRDGPDALKAKVHPGPKPKLSGPQIERLQKLLLQGATHHGFATELWTLARVVGVIRKHFGVTYDPSGVWHVLRRMGWWAGRARSPNAVRGNAMNKPLGALTGEVQHGVTITSPPVAY